MLPKLNAVGELPPGVHETTLDEVEEVFANTTRRRALFEGLRRAMENLRTGGVRRVYIDGSFVTDKVEPNDIDGCWELNDEVDTDILDPVFLDFSNHRQAMNAKYRVDFFIAELAFLEFFQRNRNDEPKGILMIDIR